MTEPRKTTEAARTPKDALSGHAIYCPEHATMHMTIARDFERRYAELMRGERQRYSELIEAAREPLNAILEAAGKADIIGIDPAARRVFEGIMTLIEEKARAALAAIEQEGRSHDE